MRRPALPLPWWVVLHTQQPASERVSEALTDAISYVSFFACLQEEDRTMEDMIQYCDIMFELNTAGPAIPLSGAGGGPGVAVSTPPIVTGPTSLKRSNAIGTGAIGTSTSHAPTLTLPEQQEISDFALQWPEQKGNSAHVKSLSDSIAQPESERLDVPLSPGAFSDSAAGEGEHEHERTAQPALSRLDTEMRAGRRTAGAAPALDVAGANNHTNQLSVSNGGDESETRRSSLNAEVWKDVGPLYLAASSAALAPSMPSPSPSSVSSVNASPGHPTPTRTDVTAAPFTQLRADRMGQTQLP